MAVIEKIGTKRLVVGAHYGTGALRWLAAFRLEISKLLARVPRMLGRNDQEWMKHTLWYSEGNRLAYKPVNLKPLTVDSVPPKVRTF